MDSLDIVTLIENNPIVKLNGNYKSKLVNKIKNEFTDTQQQLFVSSFYCYLNYDSTNDFVIKLNDVWKWIGFSRIEESKRVLKRNFKKDIDYRVEILIPQVGGIKKGRGGDRKSELITMTIKTFKKFCMKARTDKADEIHDYYIKLEEIINETVNEESEELRMKLENKDKELEDKIKLIETLKNKGKKSKIYIGRDPVYKHLIKVGITDDLNRRLNQHRTSNPKFEYLFSHTTDNASQIEHMYKLLLKNYTVNKPEWFEIDYNKGKKIMDYCVMMYDNYNIHKDIDNLLIYVDRYMINRLSKACSTRQYFLASLYERYIKENLIITNDNTKISMKLLISDFEKWIKINDIPPSKDLRSKNSNLITSFSMEFKKKISELTGIELINKLDINDHIRNVYSSKSVGWIGLELKNIKEISSFFRESDYKKFIEEEFNYNNLTELGGKISRTELQIKFLDWTNENGIICNRSEDLRPKIKSNFTKAFNKEFVEIICKLMNIKYDSDRRVGKVYGIFLI